MTILNIVNVYHFSTTMYEDAFLYSIKNDTAPVTFSYYLLSKLVNKKPETEKLANPIQFLQENNLKLKALDKKDPNYDNFISLLATTIKEKEQQKEISIHKMKNKQL